MNSLRPTSVCDTTPLQRLESQSSSSEEAPSANFNGLCTNIPARITLIASANSGTTKTAAAASTATAFQSVNAPVTTTALTANATSTNTATTTTVTLVPIKHLNNNNNKIEISFNHLIAGKTNEKSKMHLLGARQIFTRIVLDLLLLSCVALPVLSFNLWGEPFKRGFFCDDESLKHPYHESTIQSWMLYLVCLVIPILLIITVEFFKANSNKMRGFDQLSSERYYICHMEIPSWIIECYKKIGILIFGCGVEQLTTEIAKFSIGRLRPHFFAVCQPIMYDGTTCNDPINAQRYIEDYACLGVDVTSKMLKEVSLSFPSGHASFSFFTMIYIAVYLQKRMTWKRAKLCRHFLQFLFLMFAWYTTLTRVSDYKHHWTDVIAGSTIGIVYALIVTSSMW